MGQKDVRAERGPVNQIDKIGAQGSGDYIEIRDAELHDRSGRPDAEVLTEPDLEAEICVKAVGGNEYHLHHCASRRSCVGIDNRGIRREKKIGAEEEISAEK